MQQHKKLVAKASKSEEHKQALEGLQAIVESMRTSYEQLQADLKDSDTNVVNDEKKRLLEKSTSHRLEAEGLRRSLKAFENGRNDAQAEIARLLDQKKEMERKLESVEVEYMAKFHNTDAYTNFFDYFAKVSHQEVLAVLRSDYLDFNIVPLETRFLPPDDEDDS
ncbi:Uncharacterized protein Adt_16498 [Abeliophyllum distichum]|uniref:Uncharacterized protein n=1 Tax=Abeliophyllum distichum TaxID=126358 RepID=A0ABD1TDU5_9LAMI